VRLLICAGGTGGGVYPALAVLQALHEHKPIWNTDDSVLWVGGDKGMEQEILSRQNIEFKTIPAAGLHGVGLKSLPGNISLLIKGYLKARQILREFCPDVLFFTGGYLAVPVAIAGRSVPRNQVWRSRPSQTSQLKLQSRWTRPGCIFRPQNR